MEECSLVPSPTPHKLLVPKYKFENDNGNISLHLNEFRFPHCQNVLDAIRDCITSHNLSQYNRSSDLTQDTLIACSEYANVHADNIMLTNGADEALRLIADIYLRSGQPCIIPIPSYTQYTRFAQMADAQIINTKYQLPDIESALTAFPNAVIFLGCPNNPTGETFKHHDLDKLIANHKSALFVLDQVYIDYTLLAHDITYVPNIGHKNAVYIRSFSKVFGLADMRIAYMIANIDLIEILGTHFNHKNVSSVSKCAIRSVLKNIDYYKRLAMLILSEKARVQSAFTGVGLECADTQTNYLLVHVSDAAGLCSRMEQLHGVNIRNVSKYTHRQSVRITIGTPEENTRLIEGISEFFLS